MIIINEKELENISNELFNQDILNGSLVNLKTNMIGVIGTIESAESSTINNMINSYFANTKEKDLYQIFSDILNIKVDRDVILLEYLYFNNKINNFVEEYSHKGPIILKDKSVSLYDIKESIQERVFVETSFDTDLDSKKDLVEVYITRPRETLSKMKSPVIFVANPYMMTCNEEVYETHLHNVNFVRHTLKDKKSLTPQKVGNLQIERKAEEFAYTSNFNHPEFEAISEYLNYYLSRGYSLVFYTGRGTLNSEGINITGSELEIDAVLSVLQWLEGEKKLTKILILMKR